MNKNDTTKKSTGRTGTVILAALIALSAVVMGAVFTAKKPSSAVPGFVAAASAELKTEAGKGTKTVSVPVQGMSCISCAASVKKGLTSLEGVSEAHVSLEKRSAEVRYDDKKTSPEKIRVKVEAMGFKSGPPVAVTSEK